MLYEEMLNYASVEPALFFVHKNYNEALTKISHSRYSENPKVSSDRNDVMGLTETTATKTKMATQHRFPCSAPLFNRD